jgi:NHL repeat
VSIESSQMDDRGGVGCRAALALIGAGFALLVGVLPGLSTSALAAPAELWTKCTPGATAGQCNIPRGIAADPRNGHVFVGDQVNRRADEFNALGQFIKAWGWDVVQSGPDDDTSLPEDQFEICIPSKGDTCKEGLNGAGVGQLSAALGLAVDSNGNISVVDFSNHRVQKFDPNGNFLLMVGGQVNETSGGNVCPRPGFPADVCKAAPAASGGAGPGEFGAWGIGDVIAIDATDKIYVGDAGRIQRFNAAGEYQSECALPGKTVQSLATDSSGNLYYVNSGEPGVHKLSSSCEALSPTFELPKLGSSPPVPTAVTVDSAGSVYAFGPTNPGDVTDPIFEFDPTGKLIDQFGKGKFDASTGLATNLCPESEAPGNLYVSNTSGPNAFVRAYGTQPTGCFRARTLPAENVAEHAATLKGTVNPKGEAVTECFFEYGTTTGYGNTTPCVPGAGEIGTGSAPVSVHADIAGLEKGTIYHFRLLAKVGGELETGSDEAFKTLGPPVISDEHAASVSATEATLAALVNPEGFATTYRFQYTTQAAFEEAGGFGGALSSALTPVGGDRTDHAASAVIKSLSPGIVYRWRIVASNSSGESASGAHAFTTYPAFVAQTGCPSQALRTGSSALLPDCRAYEMVSPLDKNGGDIVSARSGAADPGGYVQSAPDGEKITYTALTSFGDQQASMRFNQYLARRESGGWSSNGIHPPVTGAEVPEGIQFGFNREFIAFTPDLCSTWLIDFQTPPLTPDGQQDRRNLYRRDNCAPGVGALEAMIPSPEVELPPITPENERYVRNTSVQGVSGDGNHAFFTAGVPLTDDAAEGTNTQVYDRFGGANHLVSVLPNGSAAAGPSAVGSDWDGNLTGAVSNDGSHVYWTAGISNTGFGTIYLRENPEQGIVAGECSEPAKACTVRVSGILPSFFWAGTPDGSKALYSEGEELYEFDLSDGSRRLIAAAVRSVAGASQDLKRVYFISNSALTGGAQAGKPNLYLDDEGTLRFVATLSEKDMGEKEPGAVFAAYELGSKVSFARAIRVSADGSRIAFLSRAPLTGFDNTDASGKVAVEVFAYEAGGELECVSCNPSGARPQTRELRQFYALSVEAATAPTLVPAAAWIPSPEHSLHASNLLSADGNRLFFNANDALVPRDTNGAQDVYEWEAAGTGGCSEADPSFFPQNGGCLYLISSGESSHESEFWEASPDGRDVFFTTASSLVPQDPGLVDLYDARIGGGFAQPLSKAPCEGEACQSPPPPPEFPTPASNAFEGPGNSHQAKPRQCPKSKRKVKRKGKVHCVKKGRKGHHRQAGHNRRASR